MSGQLCHFTFKMTQLAAHYDFFHSNKSHSDIFQGAILISAVVQKDETSWRPKNLGVAEDAKSRVFKTLWSSISVARTIRRGKN